MKPVDLESFLSALARGLVGAQIQLDEYTRSCVDGLVSPAWFTWRRCRLGVTVAFECRAKRSAVGKTALGLASRPRGPGQVAVSIAYLPIEGPG